MTRILIVLALFLSGSAFAQNSTFTYRAKFDGVSTPEKAAEVMKSMESIFRTTSTFNESSGYVEFSSKMSLNQMMFTRTMKDEGYPVEIFEKQEIKDTAPSASSGIVEAKKD